METPGEKGEKDREPNHSGIQGKAQQLLNTNKISEGT